MTLEVCCGNIESVHAAVQGGAPRIELCSHLEMDGLTPAWEDLKTARTLYPQLTIHVLIRPRGGNFCYSPAEVRQMAGEIATALELGADGIVVGALTAEGDVDLSAMQQLMAPNVTFHRAFDHCRNPFQALEEIIGLGCRRILTSGQAATALEGATLIRALREQAAGRILLLPGGGVSPENARQIIQFTGCTELHASASIKKADDTKVTSAPKVAAILKAVYSE